MRETPVVEAILNLQKKILAVIMLDMFASRSAYHYLKLSSNSANSFNLRLLLNDN